MTLTLGSLFSGIGGLEYGLEMTGGFKTVWQVENNEFCREVLAKHWPEVTRYEDVKDVGRHNLAPVDVICGGFPCQDISASGKGAGLDGERSGLWREFVRLLCDLRPSYAVVENVGALAFRGLGRVLGDLAASGYDAEWNCISAGDVGAPHRRERLFILAYADRQRCRRPSLRPTAIRQFERSTPTPFRLPELPESPVCRVDDVVPYRVERTRALGNAVVPQCARVIGDWLLEIDRELTFVMPNRDIASLHDA